jgi:hypothetical protein
MVGLNHLNAPVFMQVFAIVPKVGYHSLGDLNVTNKPNKLMFLKINRLSIYLECTLGLMTNKTNKQTTFL